MSAEDEEDDYMSDAILLQCQDTRPGLVTSSKLAKQYKKEEKQKTANSKNYHKPKNVLEKEKREEGLKSAIGSDNKGFALLQKMGYKPGMSIGKKGEGRSEPVPIEIKYDHRGGLGRVADLKRKQAQKAEKRTILAHKRQKIETQLKQDFQQRLSGRFSEQRAEKDLYKSQKVCEQLDSQMNITEPQELFYWPTSTLPAKKRKNKNTDSNNEDQMSGYNFEAYEEDDDDDLDDDDDDEDDEEEYCDDRPASEKLQSLTEYLRSKHKYCVWCGITFNDDEDLKSNCPGDTAEVHDE